MKSNLLLLELSLSIASLMLLTSCGGSGSSGSPSTTSQASIVVTTISDPSVPVVSVVADKQWNQRIILVGNKNATNTPINLTEVHFSTLGGDLKIELSSDGLPSEVSDLAGNKYTLTNYTTNTVDITFFDQEGGRIVGPTTISLDSAKLATLKNNYAAILQGQMSTGLQQAALSRDEQKIWLQFEGNVFDAVVCAGGLYFALPTGFTSLALSAASCVKTAVLMNIALNTPSEIASNSIDIVSTSVDTMPLAWPTLAVSKALEYSPVILDNLVPPDQQIWLDPGILSRHDSIGIYWKGSEGDSSVNDYYITRIRDDNKSSTNFTSSLAYFRDDYEIIPGKKYCYQVQARNAAGFSVISGQQCATVPIFSPPLVVTGSATNVSPTSVTLNGSVNSNGAATNAYFEYGTSVSYGNQVGSISAGNGTSSIPMQYDLSGLVPNTIYHYRVVGTNSEGSATYGSDQTFQSVVPVNSAPTISNVSPSTVTGSDNAQPFTIDGSNFVAGANITLRDKSTGEVFPNRHATSFANTSISLSVVFTTAPHTWSVNVVNPDGSSTGEYVFTVSAPSTGPLSFTSLSPSLVSANTAGYQPLLTALGSNFTNVTQISFNWSGVTSGNSTWIKYDPNWLSKLIVHHKV